MGDNVCGNKSSCSCEGKGQLCAKEVQSLEQKKCCAIIRRLEHRKEGDLWKEDLCHKQSDISGRYVE